MRAAFSKGPVTYGDVLDVAPFENKICFLTLKGDKVLELFREMASVGGEAVSHGVNLVITKDYKLKSASLNGKPIDPQADYRVATLDYLAQGNDKMVAFKAKTNVVSPQNTENNVRFLIINYFREQTAQGKVVDREVEGRIVVE
jgi:2',3'-cyclic-nucleotide 2'-phosphodiesterase (5'-nucleotidase family)